MLFKDITIIDENLDVKDHMYVGVTDDRIDYVSDKEPDNSNDYGEIYNGQNKLLMPGFYNLHAHVPMVLLRSYADNQPLDQWLNDWIFPFEAKLKEDDYYWGMLLGLAEMARFGIVSSSDMYFFGEQRIKAISQMNMKCNVSECILAFDDSRFVDHPYYEPTLNLVKNYHNSDDGRIIIDANVHSEYCSQEPIVRDVIDFAKENNLINTIHISETQKEHEECKERHNGMTPVEYFDSLGAFDCPTLIAHGVWLEPYDLEILAKNNASLATCPASNLKLGSGIANLPAVLNAGVNLTIGTDGMASNNNHNFLSDMYLVSILNRGAYQDSTLMPAKDVFYAATRAGALAQGRNDCGLLKQSFKADLCVMDMNDPTWYPCENILNNLIYSGLGSDICLTMVDGHVVYRDGQWPDIDIDQVKSENVARRKRIVSEL